MFHYHHCQILDHGTSFTKKGRQSASGEGRHLSWSNHDCCPHIGRSRTTNGQMKAISYGEFNGFPGRRDGPNHADRLDRASRVLSARMPRKKLQAKKSPSVLSVEAAYQPTPSVASQRIKPGQNHFPDATAISHIKRHKVAINRNRIAIYYFRSIAIETQSERPPKISTSFQFSGSAIEN